MFCPKCGAQNPDNAAFCGSCGEPTSAQPVFQQQPPAYAQPAAYPEAVPAAGPTYSQGGVAIGKPGLSNRTVLIALIAVAAVVVIAIIVGFVTCSGPGKVNLNSLVSDDSDKAAHAVEKMSSGKIGGTHAFTANDDMKDLLKDVNKSFGDSKKKIKGLSDDIGRTNPWAVSLMDDDYSALSLKDLQKGDDPSYASYVTYRVMDRPTCEDIAKVVSEVADFDKAIVGYFDDDDGRFDGQAMNGDDVLMSINAYPFGDVWQINVQATRLDEVKHEDELIDDFDDYYSGDYEDRDYDDTYVK